MNPTEPENNHETAQNINSESTIESEPEPEIKIVCHNGEPFLSQTIESGVSKYSPTWRPAFDPASVKQRCHNDPTHTHYDNFQTFRTCSYCGSIHPIDLLSALKNGATVHGSDWKYGWPHKFYIEKVPNKYPDLPVVASWVSHIENGKSVLLCEGDHPAGPYHHAKWYNKHFLDIANTPLFIELRDAIYAKHKVYFNIDDKGLFFSCSPRRVSINLSN